MYLHTDYFLPGWLISAIAAGRARIMGHPVRRSYSVSTNFRLELIELSAREVFIFWILVEREEGGE